MTFIYKGIPDDITESLDKASNGLVAEGKLIHLYCLMLATFLLFASRQDLDLDANQSI